MTLKQIAKNISSAAAATGVTLNSNIENNTDSKIKKEMFENIDSIEKRVAEMQQNSNNNLSGNTEYFEELRKISESLKDSINQTSSELETSKGILEQIGDIIENIKGIVESKGNISDIISNYNEILSTLTVTELGALGHLLAAIFILLCLSSIIAIIYGDFLINYFKMEDKFPKLAKYIQLRRKFQQYYLFLNLIQIIFILFLIIYINIRVLFNL